MFFYVRCIRWFGAVFVPLPHKCICYFSIFYVIINNTCIYMYQFRSDIHNVIVCAVWKILKIISSTWWTIWTALYCIICTYQRLQHRHQNTDTFVDFEERRAHLLRIMRIMYLLSIGKAVMHSSIIWQCRLTWK
jgi:hypothetical protein